MKKFLILVGIIVLSVSMLSACSKERSKTYEGDVDGKHVITTLTYKKNKVLKQNTISTLKYNDLGMSKEEGKKTFDDNRSLKDYKGVSYKLEDKHEKLVENVEIDYKKADLKKIGKQLPYATLSKNGKKVNMEGSVRYLKHLGFKQKSNMTED
ncbi:DUF1307 domain-containing protein [Staphylococcus petrasii]|uniref:DUF1307 domain-containing protein n=1 Tax=Staphylococcus petrasii TaxID=1276936 RepID=UPI001F5AA73B|nr:DUF1307 domain-containing protein [Staphylococcus petrasii]MCI2774798.1 DUF1307 domain-containing protein [Staphylococcus petrasii]